ncbi:hypothetical protein [Pseudoblastomonas halimionae]|uniref:Uncharacterized protein n=1 Tax=Alteriqipengyuania halimionae TaxID=1926630 RepID=A0A6I4U1P8_9SPHN|nr:hypothetical protein [Alteriqipengyuania halimionae]MXP09646.1 hypothetical protein [Alteriqipengyuania halimionae]
MGTEKTRAVDLDGTLQRLDGGSCVNQRALKTAHALFTLTPGTRNEPISLGELLEALWVLELMLTSNKVSFDGTLPPSKVAQLQDELDDLVRDNNFDRDLFGPVRPRNLAAQTGFMVASAGRALDDLAPAATANGAVAPTEGLDQPFRGASDAFFAKLAEAKEYLRRSDHWLESEEFASWADGGFSGSKCVAGISGCGPEAIDAALALPETYGIDRALAMGTLVNRFRFSYIRQLAFAGQDVYVPPDRWQRLSQFHALTFQEAVSHHFRETAIADAHQLIDEANADSGYRLALPPLGLFAFLQKDVKSPQDILARAHADFAQYGLLFRKFSQTTRELPPPEGGWVAMLGDEGLDAEHERIERFLSDRLGKFDHEARHDNASLMQRIKTTAIDFATGEAGSAMFNAVGATLSVTLGPLTSVGSFMTGKMLGSLYGEGTYRLLGHYDQYRDLKTRLTGKFEHVELSTIERKVKQVFGTELTLQSGQRV